MYKILKIMNCKGEYSNEVWTSLNTLNEAYSQIEWLVEVARCKAHPNCKAVFELQYAEKNA